MASARRSILGAHRLDTERRTVSANLPDRAPSSRTENRDHHPPAPSAPRRHLGLLQAAPAYLAASAFCKV